MTKLDKTTPIDPASEIQDKRTRDLFVAAKKRKEAAGRTGTVALAELVQDYVIALRDLGIPYNAHALGLLGNGDLFVFGKPCHPRDVAEFFEAGCDIATLTEVAAELRSKLEFAAGPIAPEADMEKPQTINLESHHNLNPGSKPPRPSPVKPHRK